MRPSDLPGFQAMPCGTRTKYVAARCRCPKCRAANSGYVVARDRLAKDTARELAGEAERSRRDWVRWRLSLDAVLPGRKAPTLPARKAGQPQVWTAPDGTKRVRVYGRACQGVNGAPCRYGSHLRKDSSGDVCLRCRARLAAVWNGLVSSAAVRVHLRKLSRQGVGYKSVAIAADVGKTVLADILFHDKPQLRAQAARRILAIDRDAVADCALVNAGPTWRRLNRLLSEGFTKTELARRLGSKARTPALRFKGRYVLARTAARVERFYHLVMVA